MSLSRRTDLLPPASSRSSERLAAAYDTAFALIVALGAFLMVGLMPGMAFAQAKTSAIATVICEVTYMFTSGVGIVMGVIAISILGLTAALGRISWPTALTTVVGIALIFGAGSIVGWFAVGSAPCQGVKTVLQAPQLQSVLCKVFTALQGSIGASLATIAVCMLGFGALLGKVQWASALTVIIGLIVLFSASSTLQVLYANNGSLGGLSVATFLDKNCSRPVMDFGYFSQSMCMIAAFISGKKGTIASVIAVMAVWITAFSAMYGRVSWSVAMTLAVGMALIFGASAVVGYVSGRNIACQVYASGQTAGDFLELSVRKSKSGAKCADPITGQVVDCFAVDLMN